MFECMIDVVALGELLVDFTPCETKDGIYYQPNPGGAPANVAATVSKLGGRGAFIGMVGRDFFGRMLTSALSEVGVDITGLCDTETAHTTLAFVHLDPSGERSFTFYRNPGADMLLRDTDVNRKLIESSKVFHFGSISLIREPVRSTTLKTIRTAKEQGNIVSYDPNYRASLWDSLEIARETILDVMKFCDILKLSEEELFFLTETGTVEDRVQSLSERYCVKVILITRGSKGCYFKTDTASGSLASYSVQPLDTTGAGDAFLGAFLYKLTKDTIGSATDLTHITKEKLTEYVNFANATAALTTTKKGGITSIPALSEVEGIISGGTSY